MSRGEKSGVKFLTVKCMESADGGKSWQWPAKEDIYTFQEQDVLRELRNPVPYTSFRLGRNETYTFDTEE